MAYDVLRICKYVVNYSNDKGYDISPLRLHKLLFYIQAYFLLTKEEPCFYEDIVACSSGMIVPAIYYETLRLPRSKGYDSSTFIIKNEDKSLIKAVIDKFAEYSATDMIVLNMNQKIWSDNYERGKQNKITIDMIKRYFEDPKPRYSKLDFNAV